MKLVRIINMCPNKTYIRVRVGKLLSDMFPVKKGLKQEMLCRHYSSTLFHSMPL
jgi:hypothetical protein